jgi:hypothetical protein
MKRIGSLKALLSGIILLIMFISACTPCRVPVDEFNQAPAGGDESPREVPETPLPIGDSAPAEEAQPIATQSLIVPEGIPIMDGATNLQVARDGTNIQFQIDGAIVDVVAFYQEVLPDFGWEIAGPPDNVIGLIATMLAINMQANELGGLVLLTITVNRVQ